MDHTMSSGTPQIVFFRMEESDIKIVYPYKIEFFEKYGNQVVFAVVILGTVYWLVQRCTSSLRERLGNTEPGPEHTNLTTGKFRFTSCESPGCVRCQKYHLYLSHAHGKLRKFSEDFGIDDMERISGAITSPVPFDRVDQRPNVLYVPGLTAQRWWSDSLHFESAVQTLSEHSEEIMIEYKNIISPTTVDIDKSAWSANNTPTGSWSTFYLYNQGMKYLENCQLCPKTTALIERLPQFMKGSIFGNALFSVIQPKTEIAEHFGPCNIRVRCHLGLVTPTDCYLEVSHERCQWHSSQCLLFDDSFAHSVHFPGQESGPRVIFLVDLWHPEVTEKEKQALNYIFRMDKKHQMSK